MWSCSSLAYFDDLMVHRLGQSEIRSNHSKRQLRPNGSMVSNHIWSIQSSFNNIAHIPTVAYSSSMASQQSIVVVFDSILQAMSVDFEFNDLALITEQAVHLLKVS